MSNLSRQKPQLRIPSLERFIPVADPALGVDASQISDVAKQRHYARYAAIIQLIKGHTGKRDLVCDIGSGSGYGTFMLSQHFRRVMGVEPDDFSRRYSAKHYPEVLFANDLGDLTADVAVMVESMEHMSEPEFGLYVQNTRVLAVTTPIVEHPDNEFHVHAFKKAEDVHDYVMRWDFRPCAVKMMTGISFSTGEVGANLYATYLRAI